ncbi:ankyrin repeat-containing domain protein [Echria macrotheca]|uniref:Ankyrin repeat-containing domain protein n=1 Tax=Echria macrotheca TaxID=438768 RepID=A0AAJ0B8E4_9PEZI|nr:ankyrin repeat-containing domain protein [Echria macrotheca]
MSDHIIYRKPPRVNRFGDNLVSWARQGSLDSVKRSLENGDNINVQDNWSGETALMLAARHGYDEIFELLLSNDPAPKVNIQDDYGVTAIHWLAQRGHAGYVEKLRAMGAASHNDDAGRTPLYMAIQSSDNKIATIEAVFDALGAPDPNATDPRASLLIAAVSRHDAAHEIVKFLLSKGADPYLTDDADRTVFYYALKAKKNELVELIFSERPPRKEHGNLFILASAFKGDADLTRLLHAHPDLDINAGGEGSDTVLHMAALANLTTPTLLNHRDLQLDTFGDDGRSPLYLAARYGNLEFIQAFVRRNGPRPNLELQNGMFQTTALAAAISFGHEHVMRFLIEEGANIYARDSDMDSLFHWTLGDPKLISIIINTKPRLGAESTSRAKVIAYAVSELENFVSISSGNFRDILGDAEYLEVVDQDGKSPLSWAAEMEYTGALKSMLFDFINQGGEKSSDALKRFVNKVDNDGRSPLSLAAAKGGGEVVQILLESPFGVELDSEDRERRSALYHAAVNGHLRVAKMLTERGARLRVLDDKDIVQILHNEVQQSVKEFEEAEREVISASLTMAKARPELSGLDPNGSVSGILRASIKARAKAGGGTTKQVGHLAVKRAELALAEANLRRAEAKYRLTSQIRVHDFLKSYSALLATFGFSAGLAEDMFTATVLQIRGSDSDSPSLPEEVTVRQLLSDAGHDKRGGAVCQWLHLPANNMKWVEVLIANHYKYCEEDNRQIWNAESVLRPHVWRNRLHLPTKPQKFHARFMQPGCYPLGLDATGQTTNAGGRRVKFTFEGDDEAEWSPHPGGFVLFMPYLHWEDRKDFEAREYIINEKKKPKSSDESGMPAGKKKTETDDAPHLNAEKELLSSYLEFDPPLHCRRTLDQYYYHTLANTSRRDNDQTAMRYFRDDSDMKPPMTMVDQLWMWVLPACGSSPPTVITAFPEGGLRKYPENGTALISNITETILRLHETSCDAIALVIASECMKIYLEPRTTGDEHLQFLEIYHSSIAQILDRDAERYIDFKESEGNASVRKSKSSDIKEEIRDLGYIKDIRDELGIMAVLLHSQKKVLQDMSDNMFGDSDSDTDTPLSLFVDKYLDEIGRLDDFAKRAADAIENLIDLKHKQSILSIYSETEKQGNTIMYFTVVTIVFLPLSFMASFLTINVDEFPSTTGGGLHLSFVLEVIFTVSLALVLPSLLMAFNLDQSTRNARMERWREHGRLLKEGLISKWRRSPAKDSAKVDKRGPMVVKQKGKPARRGAFRQWVGRLQYRSHTSATGPVLDEEKGVPKETVRSLSR